MSNPADKKTIFQHTPDRRLNPDEIDAVVSKISELSREEKGEMFSVLLPEWIRGEDGPSRIYFLSYIPREYGGLIPGMHFDEMFFSDGVKKMEANGDESRPDRKALKGIFLALLKGAHEIEVDATKRYIAHKIEDPSAINDINAARLKIIQAALRLWTAA